MTKDKKQEKELETYVPDWAFVTGRLDSTFKMLACPKDKYKEVTINLTPQPKNLGNGRISHGFNYSIAKIDLHNGTYGSASKVFDDATKLAEQIAKRWNEYDSLYTENAKLMEALTEIVKHTDDMMNARTDLEYNLSSVNRTNAIEQAKQLLTDSTKEDEK